MVEGIDSPPVKDVENGPPVDVVARSCVAQARSEEEAPTGAQDPPHLGFVLGAILGVQVVKATPVEHKIRHVVTDRKSSHVSDEELGTVIDCVPTSDGHRGQIDPQRSPTASGQMGDLSAQTAPKVDDNPRRSDPPVRLGGE